MKMKSMRTILAAGVMGAALLGVSLPYAAAAEQPAAEAPFQANISLPYKYTSKAYGFTIQCPQKPLGVIEASALYGEGKKGEILIFDNEEYNIKHAWIILKDAFSDNVPDLNKLAGDQANEALARIMDSNGYEGIMLMKLNDRNRAIFAMTAKEIEIDSNGDGIIDGTAKADTQMAVMFFRGEDGGHYSLQLIDNPELRENSVLALQEAAKTFKAKK